MLSFGKLNYHRSDIRLFGIQSLARLPLDITAKVKKTRHKTMTVKVYSPLPVHNQCMCMGFDCVCVAVWSILLYGIACMHDHSLTHTDVRASIVCKTIVSATFFFLMLWCLPLCDLWFPHRTIYTCVRTYVFGFAVYIAYACTFFGSFCMALSLCWCADSLPHR